MTVEHKGNKVYLTNAKVRKCEKCGSNMVAWQQSSSGKFYLVNVEYEGSTPICYRADRTYIRVFDKEKV